jgi:MTH538 TIR-like domain (DUF1863)
MAWNVFVSFDHNDQRQVGAFKLLKNNPNHPLEFQDHSLKDAVRDRSGKAIEHPRSDSRSKPVRDAILAQFDRASKPVVLVGNNSHASKWVEWEIDTFHALKQPLSKENTWKRIRGDDSERV